MLTSKNKAETRRLLTNRLICISANGSVEVISRFGIRVINFDAFTPFSLLKIFYAQYQVVSFMFSGCMNQFVLCADCSRSNITLWPLCKHSFLLPIFLVSCLYTEMPLTLSIDNKCRRCRLPENIQLPGYLQDKTGASLLMRHPFYLFYDEDHRCLYPQPPK